MNHIRQLSNLAQDWHKVNLCSLNICHIFTCLKYQIPLSNDCHSHDQWLPSYSHSSHQPIIFIERISLTAHTTTKAMLSTSAMTTNSIHWGDSNIHWQQVRAYGDTSGVGRCHWLLIDAITLLPPLQKDIRAEAGSPLILKDSIQWPVCVCTHSLGYKLTNDRWGLSD